MPESFYVKRVAWPALFFTLLVFGATPDVRAQAAAIQASTPEPLAQGMRVILNIAPPTLEAAPAPNGQTYTRLVLKGVGMENAYGKPALPVLHYTCEVPPGIHVVAVADARKLREFKVDQPLWPHQRPVPKVASVVLPGDFLVDADAYQGDPSGEFQQAENGVIQVVQYTQRGKTYVDVLTRPFAYQAAGGIVRYPQELALTLSYVAPDLPKAAGPRLGRIVVLDLMLQGQADLDWLTTEGYNFERRGVDHVEIFATEAEVQALKDAGFDVVETGQQPAPAPQAESGAKGLGTNYHTYATLTSELQQYTNRYFNYCRLYSIGRTGQNRDLWAMKITANPDATNGALKPRVRLASTIHGDEPLGVEMCLYLVDQLVTGCVTNTRISNLVATTEIWILPLVNPDGLEAGTRYNAAGFDLNRSFPSGGGGGLGNPLFGPQMTTYGRPIEVAALMQLATNHSFTLAANFHGGSLVVNYPYDDDDLGSVNSPSPDDGLFRVLSRIYASNNPPMWVSASFPQGVVNGAAWYVAVGGWQDWSYRYVGCNEVTIEISDNKQPTVSQIPQFWNDNREAMLSYIESVQTRVFGAITNAATLQPVYAAVKVLGAEHGVFSDPQQGDYHRMVLPGTYHLLFTAPGYGSQIISNVVVQAGQPTRLDVQLQPTSHPAERILLVTTDTLSNSLPALVARKQADGFAVQSVVVPVGSSTNRIRTAIRDVFALFPAEYILLVGDVDQIPVWTDGTADFTHPTDLPYALIDAGETCANYLGKDAVLGRISLKTSAAIAEFTQKLDAIARSRTNRTYDLTWVSNGHNVSEYAQAERGHEYCISNCVPASYNATRFFQGIGTAAGLSAHINAGTDGVIYSGHGSEFLWEGYSYNASALAGLNNVNNVVIVLAHCCVSGSFDMDVCVGEAWLQTSARGALYVGATDNTYWDNDEAMQKAEFDAMRDNAGLSVGRAVDQGLYQVQQLYPTDARYYYTTYHNLGDPTLVLLETVAGPLALRTTNLGPAVLGGTYSESLLAVGGVRPFTWSVVAGQLPANLTLNSASGILSGVPAQTGTNQFTIQVRDSSPTPQVVRRALTLTVLDQSAQFNLALDTANQTWAPGGSAAWFSQTAITHDGTDAAQSGAITDSQETWIETTMNGPCSMSFWWKVSSEGNYDFLEFYLNGTLQTKISGEVDWTQQTIALPAGQQTLRWRYSKDSSVSKGQDAGWVDQVAFFNHPVISQAPDNVTATLHTPVNFQVIATGSTPLYYQWFLDAAPIARATNATYGISSVAYVHAGPYSVAVSNANGVAISPPAKLTVLPPGSMQNSNLMVAGVISIPLLGTATPYPSSVVVAGLTGKVQKVSVTLSNLTHSYAKDLQILVTNPAGNAVLLLANIGNTLSITNATLTFDDAGAAMPIQSAVVSGTYRPAGVTNLLVMPSPAPTGAYATNVSALTGGTPNGTWSLFINDSALGDSGTLDGWSLNIVTTPEVTPPALVSPTVAAGQLRFNLRPESGRTWVIEYKDGMNKPTWQTYQTLSGDDTLHTISNLCTGVPNRFFRVRMQ
ncbi:MAG: M14 family zinc carboxypeptidase [Verrucomicrobiota bacterium]